MVSLGQLVRNVNVTLGPDILSPCDSVSVSVKVCAVILCITYILIVWVFTYQELSLPNQTAKGF